jgi:hypothetical protein
MKGRIMKKIMLIAVFVTAIFRLAFCAGPSSNPATGLHIRDYLILYNNVYVSFQEEVCARVYGDWQMQITDVSSPQTKALLALVINAKNNQSSLSVWWAGGIANPTTISDLTTIQGACER